MTRRAAPWTEHAPKTIDDLIFILRELGETPDAACRGESSQLFTGLLPSFDRLALDQSHVENVLRETALVDRFRQRARVHLHAEDLVSLDTVLGTLQVMRHYGSPTRLLDWSLSPWVACYFACESGPDSDGTVWAFGLNELSRATGADAAQAERTGRIEAAGSVADWAELFRTPSEHVRVVHPHRANERMLAQQGLFTLADAYGARHDELIARTVRPQARRRIVVRGALKKQTMNLLSNMNINATTLFPGADGLGQEMAENLRWRLRIAWDPAVLRLLGVPEA